MTNDDFVSAFPPLKGELAKIREYENAVAEEARRKRFFTPYHELDDEKAVTMEPTITDPKEELRDEAIVFLVERGVVIPNRDVAVELANTVAYDECVLKHAAAGGTFDIEFDGDENCGYDGDCGGWDGLEHRCECGNRRVYWEMGYGATFKDMYVIATVY